jgi:4-aminobutyrate aminotransferase
VTSGHEPEPSEGDVNLSPQRRAWSERHIDAATRELLDEDARYFLHQSLSTPCLNVLTGAQGATLTDLQGRTFLDFHGNNVHHAGFGHPKIVAAIREQMETLPFCPRRYTNVPAIRLARRLVELAPGDLKRVLFAPGGTSAIGIALKLARAATGRHKTISLWDSFHGASLDAISIGGEALFRQGMEPLLPGALHVPPPDPAGCPFGCGAECSLRCADFLEYTLAKEGDVGAVIAETVRSTGVIPPAEYWRRVRAACDRHGALLILDEIPHGLGRTGRMFTFEHFGIVPDIVVIGKALGGGIFPLAAVIAREGLNVCGEKSLGHYTHEKNPVACAAGLALLDVIAEERLVERASQLGAHALDRLRSMRERHPLIGAVRGLGLLLSLELVRDRHSREKASGEAERILYLALEQGLSFKVTMGNIVTLTPPLNIAQADLDRALDILEFCLERVA